VTSFQRAPFNFPVFETLALWVRATAQDCSIPQDPQPSLLFIFFTKTIFKGTTRAVDIANVHGVGMDGQYIHTLKTQIRKLRYYKTLQPIFQMKSQNTGGNHSRIVTKPKMHVDKAKYVCGKCIKIRQYCTAMNASFSNLCAESYNN
jgi:hypothetical protein